MSSPTQAELEILNVLWECGEASVHTVNDKISENRPVGYTTTLKTMQLMAQKGWLGRRMEGRSHIYHALLQESETKGGLLSRFIDSTFKGSKSSLLMQLLGGENDVSKQEIDEIKQYLKGLEDKNDD